MKKSLIIIVISVLVLIVVYTLFNSDAQIGNNDWSYSLPNNYEIWHINSEQIVCGKKTSEHSIGENVGGYYVSEFCYDDKYICLQCIPTYGEASDNTTKSQTDFYIIDSSTDKEYGPFTQTEFEDKLEELNLTNLCAWIKTKPRPEGAKFY